MKDIKEIDKALATLSKSYFDETEQSVEEWLVEELPLAIKHLTDELLPLGPESFQSVCVDYHPPVVHRLWVKWGGKRIFLHKIEKCIPGEIALYHPHPWPSAVKVLKGEYEMGVGEDGKDPKTTLLLKENSNYAMIDPSGWHYVKPLSACYTIMITGKPYDANVLQAANVKPGKGLRPLDNLTKSKLWIEFCNLLEVPISNQMLINLKEAI